MLVVSKFSRAVWFYLRFCVLLHTQGETAATVEFAGAFTFLGRTASLLGRTEPMSTMQSVLVRVVFYLVCYSLTLCLAVLVYISEIFSLKEALSIVVVLIVASIPMTIEIVTTTTLGLGSKELAIHGAIVTRLVAIEDMAGMAILCSNKTGTLTLNKMVIQDDTPIYAAGESQYSLLRYATMATRWREAPTNQLDSLILAAVDMHSLEFMDQIDHMPFDLIAKRTEGTIRDTRNNRVFQVATGPPHIILALCTATCHSQLLSPLPTSTSTGSGYGGDSATTNSPSDPDASIIETSTNSESFLGSLYSASYQFGTRSSSNHFTTVANQVERDVLSLGLRGMRAMAVARTNADGAWYIMGLITFSDQPRPDSARTIERARRYGITCKMITEDHLLIAREACRVLSLGAAVRDARGLPLLDAETMQKPPFLTRDYGDLCLAANGFAQVFPEHKYLIVECLRGELSKANNI